MRHENEELRQQRDSLILQKLELTQKALTVPVQLKHRESVIEDTTEHDKKEERRPEQVPVVVVNTISSKAN